MMSFTSSKMPCRGATSNIVLVQDVVPRSCSIEGQRPADTHKVTRGVFDQGDHSRTGAACLMLERTGILLCLSITTLVP